MNSRFKFVQSVNPQPLPNSATKPKFSKLMLATKKYVQKVEESTTLQPADPNAIENRLTKTVTTTTTTKTTTMAAKASLENAENQGTTCAQKPKVLLYESTIKSTVKNANNLDLLTDDDTDSVGSSIDTDFFHKALNTSGPEERTQQADQHNLDSVDIVDTQLQRLSIVSLSAEANRRSVVVNLQNVSQQFQKMDLLPKHDESKGNEEEEQEEEEKSKEERCSLYCSVVTLSTSTSSEKQVADALNDTQSVPPDSQINNIIEISDSDDDDIVLPTVKPIVSVQPPLKCYAADVEDRGMYNASSNIITSKSDVNCPSSSIMQKVNNFFDNIPSLDTDELAFNATIMSCEAPDTSHKEPTFVSETSVESSNEHENLSAADKIPIEHDNNENEEILEAEEDNVPVDAKADNNHEMSDNNIVVDIPVIKSSSDQPRQLIRSQSSTRLTATHSSPLIKTSSGIINSDGVKRSLSNVVLKKTGSSIKINSMSNGQVNISAKININIQIRDGSDDSGDDKQCENNPVSESPAIEKEPFEDHKSTQTTDSEQSSYNANYESAASDAIPSPKQNEIKTPKASKKVVANTPTKTPSTSSKIKKFEFLAPKSMTKSTTKSTRKKAPNTATKMGEAENVSKSIVVSDSDDDDGFKVDHTIPVAPNDQKLLFKLYGNDWKKPEVIESYSAVKGVPKSGNTPAAPLANSRMSKGFITFKRNIATDLDSTRMDDLTELSMIESLEPSKLASNPPTRVNKNPHETPQSKTKQTSTRKVLKSNSERSPSVLNTKKVAEDIAEVSDGSSIRAKRNNRNVRRQLLCESSEDNSDSDKENSDKSVANDSVWTNDDSNSSSSSGSNDGESDSSSKKIRRKRAIGSSRTTKRKAKTSSKDKLIYLDLSSQEVVEVGQNYRANISERDLANITQKFLESDLNVDTGDAKKTKTPFRKLFTPQFINIEEEQKLEAILKNEKPLTKKKPTGEPESSKITMPIFGTKTHKLFDSKKFGSSSTWLTPQTKLNSESDKFKTPIAKSPSGQRMCQTEVLKPKLGEFNRLAAPNTPITHMLNIPKTYGFLKSLDGSTSLKLCHPDALPFRKDFKANKEQLTDKLFALYNDKVFDGELKAPVTWNKKLTLTAGRCLCNQKSSTGPTARIELSEKVLTSSDRLRCTLIHEMCHAASWIFNKAKGHGSTWKSWASKANYTFPELPKITVCHNYDIEYKYTYQCDMCHSKSYSHSKSKKVENIRCSICHGSISIYLNKKQKDGVIVATPTRKASGFANFVKEKYKEFKKPGVTHADVMRSISAAFSVLSVEEKKKY